MSEYELKKLAAEEARGIVLDALHEQYAENDGLRTYEDIEIDGATMTYMTADLGKLILYKE